MSDLITVREFRSNIGISAQSFGAIRRVMDWFPDQKGEEFITYRNQTGSYQKAVETYDEADLKKWLDEALKRYLEKYPNSLAKPLRKPQERPAAERFDNTNARLFLSRSDSIRPRAQLPSGKTQRINTRRYGYETF